MFLIYNQTLYLSPQRYKMKAIHNGSMHKTSHIRTVFIPSKIQNELSEAIS